jgi:hypothetical protein
VAATLGTLARFLNSDARASGWHQGPGHIRITPCPEIDSVERDTKQIRWNETKLSGS